MSRPQHHGGADLGAAAVAYAVQGFRVLPLHYPTGAGVGCSCGQPACGSIGKHPLTPHGLNDATSDPARLGWWWRRWPQANIGLLTGQLADVLDVDGLAGRAALGRWATTHGLRLDGPLARTGSGWHYYLAPAGSGNRAGLLEQVDWRGVGGYVVAPPSRHASGSRYRWLRPLTPDLPHIPEPLRHLLTPSRQHQLQAAPPFRSVATGHPYGRKAFHDELAEVACAPKGRRNHTLYQAGIRLFSLVAGGVLDHAEIQAGLLAAADAAGCWPTNPSRPAARLPRPSAPAWRTPAACQPTTSRQDAPCRRRCCGSEAIRTGNAVAEPIPAAAAVPDPRASRPRRSTPAQGSDRNRLPAAPLLQAIRRRAELRRQSLRQLLGPDLFSAYGNAQAAGTISLLTLERFCDEVLGCHARMLYGDAYDQAIQLPAV